MPAKFAKGTRFTLINNPTKKGRVDRVRDDRHEQMYEWPNGSYHYSVTFDDGSFETYQSECDMKLI